MTTGMSQQAQHGMSIKKEYLGVYRQQVGMSRPNVPFQVRKLSGTVTEC